MIAALLENPARAICIVIAVLLLSKIFKLSAKMIGWILKIGIIYIILNFICSL